jgi:hypothetical protein
MSKPRKKKRQPKRALALPDLEQSKIAVLNNLTSKSGQRTYDCVITDFVDWYCSGPRLAFNRTVVLRYRIYLEQKQYAPTTINNNDQPAPGRRATSRVRSRRFRPAQSRARGWDPTG